MRHLLFSLLLVYSALAADTVTFTPSVSVAVTNYSIYYGPSPSRALTNRVHIGTSTNWVITNVGPATVAFIFASAWTNGIESLPSNEILYTNRNFSPNTLRLAGTDALLLQSSIDNRTWKTIAVITSTNPPLVLSMQPRSSFRTISTNLPPIPGQ